MFYLLFYLLYLYNDQYNKKFPSIFFVMILKLIVNLANTKKNNLLYEIRTTLLQFSANVFIIHSVCRIEYLSIKMCLYNYTKIIKTDCFQRWETNIDMLCRFCDVSLVFSIFCYSHSIFLVTCKIFGFG